MTYNTPRNDNPAAAPPPIPGESTAAAFVDHETEMSDTDRDWEENELHAAGQTCVRCHHPIAPGDDVRRHLDGTFQHEICPDS